jgi:hypothetical protein
MESVDDYINLIGAIIALLSVVAAITPTDRDNGVVDRMNNVFKKLTGRK